MPDFIADDEYKNYVEGITAIGPDAHELFEFLKSLVTDTLGLDYDDANPEHRQDLETVVAQLIEAFRSSS